MKILLVGAFGRMGVELQKSLAKARFDVRLFDHKGRGDYKSLSDIKEKIDGIVEFSTPEGLIEALKFSEKNKCPIVSGTTGLTSKHISQMKRASKKAPVLWSSNMSVGVHVLKSCLRQLAELDEGFEFQIEDIHHRHKKDAPSGTAKTLFAELEKSLGRQRSKKIHPTISIRAGGVFGVHKVYAFSDEEILMFEHQALNRAVFAKGAVMALTWLMKNKKTGLYQFEDLFK